MSAQSPVVTDLFRYPVKGLSAEPLADVAVVPGETFPHDRIYAVENGPGRFDPLSPRHLPKINFLMLMRDEKLAALQTSFEPETSVLTIRRDGRQVVRGALNTPVGRQMIQQFLAAYMGPGLRGAPKVVAAPGHSFSDVAAKCVHIVNRNSLRALERASGRVVDAIRFRPNIVIDGVPEWAEFDWLDRQITIGAVTLKVWARTQRCDATNVNPVTADRDMSVPSLLQRLVGHTDFGVYARVETAGGLKVGDVVTPPV